MLSGFLCVSLFGQTIERKTVHTNSYNITGRLIGLNNGEKVRLGMYYGLDNRGYEVVDSTVIENNSFKFTGYLKDSPRMLEVLFMNKKNSLWLYVDNGEAVTISSKDSAWILHGNINGFVDVAGSRCDWAVNMQAGITYNYKSHRRSINRYINQLSDSIGFSGSLLNGLYAIRDIIDKNMFIDLFFEPVSPKFSAAKLLRVEDLITESQHSAMLVDLYNRLDKKEQESSDGKQLKEILPFCVGQVFPGFNLETVDGMKLSLKEVTSKSKVTLVHFWGSSDFTDSRVAATLKAYHPVIENLYKKYHDKGLNVVTISADNLALWKKFIKDHPQWQSWVNVSDGQGNSEGSIIQDIYKEGGHSIPNITNYLLDNNGRIIAYDPSGVELQWYLWKIFE